MARILLAIGGHLWTSPRGQKEAAALASAGHDVSIAGVWLDEAGARRDLELARGQPWRFEPAADLRGKGPAALASRVRTRLAREAYSRAGRCFPGVLGYGAHALLRRARRAAADLTIVHSEAGLWAGCRLLDAGCRVGVDFEDWFSRDLPPEARRQRPTAWLERLERRLARDCVYRLAPSRAMAHALSAAYAVSPPQVVYNVFPDAAPDLQRAAAPDRRSHERPSVHWFSQTIGPGRGLEALFRAAACIGAPFELHLRGALDANASRWLDSALPAAVRGRTFVHETVPNGALPSRIAEHDIGVALETSAIPSRDLTVTNKIFQYLQAGLAVVATDTAGQREVFEQAPDIGVLVRDNDIEALAGALTALLTDRDALARARAAARAASSRTFAWAHQVPPLQALAQQAISEPR